MKKLVAKPVTSSLAAAGLKIDDDELLFQFIYEYRQLADDLPTYEKVLSLYNDETSVSSYEDACRRLETTVEDLKYYSDGSFCYLELADEDLWSRINIPESVNVQLDPDTLGQIYSEELFRIADEFESKTDTDLYFLGEDDQHVCVRDSVENALRYDLLKSYFETLQNEVVEYMNNLSIEEIIN